MRIHKFSLGLIQNTGRNLRLNKDRHQNNNFNISNYILYNNTNNLQHVVYVMMFKAINVWIVSKKSRNNEANTGRNKMKTHRIKLKFLEIKNIS